MRKSYTGGETFSCCPLVKLERNTSQKYDQTNCLLNEWLYDPPLADIIQNGYGYASTAAIKAVQEI